MQQVLDSLFLKTYHNIILELRIALLAALVSLYEILVSLYEILVNLYDILVFVALLHAVVVHCTDASRICKDYLVSCKMVAFTVLYIVLIKVTFT